VSEVRPDGPAFTVVVPAHEEETVVGRCLAFVAGLRDGEADVVVVANGCTDRTAEVARAVPGVRVLELAQGSKRLALDAGDAALQGGPAVPRIYLDADVVVGPEALRATAAALVGAAPRAAAPAVRFRLDGRPTLVRAFYAAYARTPYVTDGLVGLGLYGVSAAGRARWERFPDVTSDDLFVQRTFGEHERVVVAGHRFDVEVPRTLASLLAVRTRTAQGNAELAAAGREEDAASTGVTVRALVDDVRRHPRHLPAAAVYVGVVLAARHRARRRPATWHRDASTR
jgi:glycosyltransferase involved in cell wall biosynthesis